MSTQIALGTKSWPVQRPNGGAVGAPSPTEKPLEWRVLALTGSFETGAGAPDCFAGLEGDLDGQALSLGVLRWSFGRGTLQPLLREMLVRHPGVSEVALGDQYLFLMGVLLAEPADQVRWARSIQDPRWHRVVEPWRGRFALLARTEEYQAIQVKHADAVYARALGLCTTFGLVSERAVALMFDIVVQNGGIGAELGARIKEAFALPASTDWRTTELLRLRLVANHRADAAPAAVREEMRARKLTVANGEGAAHARRYDIEREFGIRLEVAK